MAACGNASCKGLAPEGSLYCGGSYCTLHARGKKTGPVGFVTDMERSAGGSGQISEVVVAARVEAVEACIETVESRIATAKACRYSEAYVAGMEDILIFHRATLERVKKGEGYHSTSELMVVKSQ